MLVYIYDKKTKKFLYTEEALIDPLETELKQENVYLLPANATFKKPLEEKEGFNVIFSNNEWIYEEIAQPEPEPEPEPTIEELQTKVRSIRNNYLESFVDPKQLVLVWDGLSEEERQLYADYRTYLLDYTKLEGWYLQNPLTLDEWKQQNME